MKPIEKISSRHFHLEEVAAGVYAAIAVEGYGAMGNAGIVDMGNYALVFDTFNTQQAAEDLKNAAEVLTGHPVRYVINSHWHGDHIRGNQVFSSSIVISSNTTFERMKTLNPERIQRQKALLPRLEEDIASFKTKLETETNWDVKQQLLLQISFLHEVRLSLPDLKLTLPTCTFDSSLTLHGTDREVKVLSLGPAHTKSDSILLLPEEKIVFSGDVVSIDNHPMLTDGEPDKWVRVLDNMGQMNITTIVPGHGPVGNRLALQQMKEYIEELTNIVDHFASQGNSIDSISTIEIPKLYYGWKAESIYYQNLRFLYNSKSQLENRPYGGIL